VHFLVGLVPFVYSAATSATRYAQKDDFLMCSLAVCSLLSKVSAMLCMSHVAFTIRMSQVLSELEIRRCEADIRVVTPSMIHRITPRFKGLLQELHYVGNKAHPLFMMMIPVFLVYVIMLAGAIMKATFDDNACVPTWCFASFFQPLTTFIIWLSAYGNLNLAIERDIDQDIGNRAFRFILPSCL